MLMKNKFVEKWQSLPPLKLCLLVYGADFFISAFLSVVLFPDMGGSDINQIKSVTERILVGVVLAPLLETVIFQGFILRKLVQWTGHKTFAVVAGALLFGLAHHYNIPYVVKAFIAGILYNLLYLSLKQRGARAIAYVAGTHMLHNLTVFILTAVFIEQ